MTPAQASPAPASTRSFRTVIFLGAGASAADGAPVQSELLKGFFESRLLAGPDHPLETMEQRLADYFDHIWGIKVDTDLANARFPTFEEVLGLLELADSRGEFFKGLSSRDPLNTRTQELRTFLISLIALHLEEKLKRPTGHNGRLVSSLGREGLLENTAFISLNYDILIDNALGPQLDSIDYAIDFDNAHPGGGLYSRRTPLLKVHGSLNWLFCPTCNEVTHYPGEKVAAQLYVRPHRGLCGKCQGARLPIIIPPTFFKVMSNLYLQQVWSRAEVELKKARRIVFCGYSFPDADIHIKYLLKRAEVNRSGLPPSVFIVNGHPDESDPARTSVGGRYLRFFREKKQVHWTGLSFEQYAENPKSIDRDGEGGCTE